MDRLDRKIIRDACDDIDALLQVSMGNGVSGIPPVLARLRNLAVEPHQRLWTMPPAFDAMGRETPRAVMRGERIFGMLLPSAERDGSYKLDGTLAAALGIPQTTFPNGQAAYGAISAALLEHDAGR